MQPTEHELWQDERDADLRDRDRQREREPQRTRLPAPRAGSPIAAVRTLRLQCPLCGGPVYTTSDSDLERVDCTEPTCRTELVTKRMLDGSVEFELVEVAP